MTLVPADKSAYGRLAVMFGSLGGGMAIVYAVLDVLKAQPQSAQLVITTVGQWGPMFALAAGILAVGSRGANRIVDVMQAQQQAHVAAAEKTATANQAMADAMRQIANKDDIAARERELLLDHIAYKQRELKDQMDRIEKALMSKAAGAAAGAA